MIKEIIRLKTQGYSHKKICEILKLSRTTVIKYVKRIEALGYLEELLKKDEAELNELLSQQQCKDFTQRYAITEDYFRYVEKELKRTGVTRWILWAEYKNKYPDGYSYSQFCYHLQKWFDHKDSWLHIDHKAGDKMFIDYAGKKLTVVDKSTGEIREVEVFIAILGASQYTYVEAVENQTLESFIRSVENAFWFFQGVPRAVVPDNLKSAVTKSSKYEPTLNERFADFSSHYNTTVLPTRSYKPKDKALVEGAVKIVYHRIYAALRNRTFFNIQELNVAIREQLEKYNTIAFQGRQESRYDLYNEMERPALGELPVQKYDLKKYKLGKVQKNCHVYLGEDKHYYSVPYKFIGQTVKMVFSTSLVEIYHDFHRIASHKRDFKKYGYTTEASHLPERYRHILEWNPDFFIKQASVIGEPTRELIQQILNNKTHPEQGYKSCQGILSFSKKYGDMRLNKACSRALQYQAYNYRIVKNILEKGLDLLEDEDFTRQVTIPFHSNIRGSKYYD